MKRSDILVTKVGGRGRNALFEAKCPLCSQTELATSYHKEDEEVMRSAAVGKIVVHLKSEHEIAVE